MTYISWSIDFALYNYHRHKLFLYIMKWHRPWVFVPLRALALVDSAQNEWNNLEIKTQIKKKLKEHYILTNIWECRNVIFIWAVSWEKGHSIMWFGTFHYMHAQLLNRARDLALCLKLLLAQFIVSANSKGSDCRIAWAFIQFAYGLAHFWLGDSLNAYFIL